MAGAGPARPGEAGHQAEVLPPVGYPSCKHLDGGPGMVKYTTTSRWLVKRQGGDHGQNKREEKKQGVLVGTTMKELLKWALLCWGFFLKKRLNGNYYFFISIFYVSQLARSAGFRLYYICFHLTGERRYKLTIKNSVPRTIFGRVPLPSFLSS